MGTSKHLWLTVLAAGLLLALGGGLFAVPNYREATAANRRIVELERKAADLNAQARQLEALAAEVADAERRIDEELKVVPSDPSIEGIYSRLSLPVDRVTVLDHKVTTGQAMAASSEEGTTVMATPLTIDMIANFESVFALLRTVELMDRLVRVTSIRMTCDRTQQISADAPLTVSMEVEAIFNPDAQEVH